MKIRTCRSYCISRAVPSGGQGGQGGRWGGGRGEQCPPEILRCFVVAENSHKYVYKQLLPPPPPPQDFEQGTAMI